ncbi:MAG: ABC-F family ATP-binding cassette domain-containing protein [Gemmatimonadota bacterium]|jgi:ATPase subunit of ABC transporter with duplicated ATPase domains
MPSPAGSLVIVEGLSHALGDGRLLFQDLALGLGRERVGLVGANGVGKSTLARILAGELRPSTGAVLRSGRVAYLPQQRTPVDGPREPGAPSTVAEALGIAPRLNALARIEAGSTDPADFDEVGTDWDVAERATSELGRLDLAQLGLDRTLASLSGGEATRVTLAGLVFDDPDVAILDEPTNDLDAASRRALYQWVESWRGGLLVISHDRELLARMERILELTPVELRSYGGDYAAYEAQKRSEHQAAARKVAHARKELRKTERDVQAARERQERRTGRGHRDRLLGGVPKVLLGIRKDRAEGTTGRLADLGDKRIAERRERLGEAQDRVADRGQLGVALRSTGLHATRMVLEMGGVRYTHPGAGTPTLVDATLVVRGPERVAVTGSNGAGKTTLLRLAMGELKPDVGVVKLGVPPDDLAYLDQRASLLRHGATVLDCFRDANPELDLTESRYALARYLFTGDAALASVDALSGGERIRAALACTVGASRPPSFLLLDEPTNHLDLDSIRAVEGALQEYDGALVVVSHDAAFLEAIGMERELAL